MVPDHPVANNTVLQFSLLAITMVVFEEKAVCETQTTPNKAIAVFTHLWSSAISNAL